MIVGWWFQPLWRIWVRQLALWNSKYMENHKIPWFQSPPTSDSWFHLWSFCGMLHSTNLCIFLSAFCTAYPVKKKGSFNSPCSETFQYHIANKISVFVLIVPSLWYSYCRHMFMFLMYNFKSFPVHFSKLMTHIPYGFLKWCISHVKSWQTMVLPKGEWPWNIPWRTILNDHEISHVSM